MTEDFENKGFLFPMSYFKSYVQKKILLVVFLIKTKNYYNEVKKELQKVHIGFSVLFFMFIETTWASKKK